MLKAVLLSGVVYAFLALLLSVVMSTLSFAPEFPNIGEIVAVTINYILVSGVAIALSTVLFNVIVRGSRSRAVLSGLGTGLVSAITVAVLQYLVLSPLCEKVVRVLVPGRTFDDTQGLLLIIYSFAVGGIQGLVFGGMGLAGADMVVNSITKNLQLPVRVTRRRQG